MFNYYFAYVVLLYFLLINLFILQVDQILLTTIIKPNKACTFFNPLEISYIYHLIHHFLTFLNSIY